MKPKRMFFMLLLTLLGVVGVKAQSAVTVSTQITSDNSLVEGTPYVLQYSLNSPYIQDVGDHYDVPRAGNSSNLTNVYRLIKDGDNWKIQNLFTGRWWPAGALQTTMVPTNAANAGSWTLTYNNGIFTPKGNGYGLDRLDPRLVSWNTSSANTIKIFEATLPEASTTPLSELVGYDVSVSSEAAASLTTNQWYVMFDRGDNGTYYHGYLYENPSSHTLFNTNTVPSGSTTSAAKYLVRLLDAGNGKYYLQTGFGNFFGNITQSTAVPVTPIISEAITIGKIANTDGHFFLQSAGGVILDANSINNGDATVVGWGTSIPTSTGGNNDWAFYPVELVESWAPTASEVYTINNTNTSRGALIYNADNPKYVWSSGKSGTFDASNANSQWVIYPTGTEGQFYLYNVGANKFAIPTGIAQSAENSWVFSDNAVAVIFEKQVDGTKKIKMATNPVSGTNAAYLAVSNNYTGPIINYNDVGGNFTITKVDGANASTAVNAAVAKLVKSQTALSTYPQTSGWYVIQIKSKDNTPSYAGRYLQPSTTLYNNLYPLTFTGAIDVQPSITDATFFTHLDCTDWDTNTWQLPDGRFLIDNGSGKFPTPSATAGNVICGYENDNYFKSNNNWFADPYNSYADYFIGETTYKRTSYTVYPIDLSAAGLTAWQMICDNAPETQAITCSRNDVSGLTSVYKNGYIFLPSSVTPTNSEFNLEGATNIVVDATNHTVSFTYNPDLALVEDGVIVEQGWQTAGRDGEVMLLRVTAKPFKDASNTTMTVSLKNGSENNISALKLYEASSNSPEIYSTGSGAPTKTQVATATISNNTATFNIGNLSAGTHYYWIGANVKADAELGAIIDAAVTGISYQVTGQTAQNLDLTSVGDPSDRGAMVFNTHSYPFLPRDNGSRFYRIPAMVVADDGSIVVAADKRYDSSTDIGGGHVIDIVIRRSEDGGKTWSAPVTIAKGLGDTDNAKCGYGDPSLVKGKDGKLYCLFVAGNIGYFYGQQRIAMSTSTNNGVTWSSSESTPPIDLLETGRLKNYDTVGEAGLGLYDYFVTSGRGLYIPNDDILMYLIPAQTMTSATEHTGNSQDYIFYSRDGGESWYFSPQTMFAGGDEAKIILMNDGSLLGSIRQGYNRGFNTATYTKNDDGKTLNFTMGSQWNNSQLNAGGYANNQDIFYYQRETVTGKTDVIIHSMTTGQHANFKLYYSTDGGANWTEFLNVQTKGTRYVTMERSGSEEDPGSLYLFFEDQSLNSAGGYTDYNHYPLNFLEITREQLESLIPELNDYSVPDFLDSKDVKIVNGLSQETTYGSWSGLTWTSNAASGVAGLTMTLSDGSYNRFSNLNGFYYLAYHPDAANTNSTLTLTAPEGYVITGYSVQTGVYEAQTYTLTPENGTAITPANLSSEYTPLTVSGLNTTSTTITITTTDATKWLALANFTVTIAKPLKLNVVGDKSYATLYLPFDVQTDADTKAYYIRELNNNIAELTEVSDGMIPALTAVVLINEKAATQTTLEVTSELPPVVSEDDNLLKGTLVPIDLNLSNETTNYSLGVISGNIGFYKFKAADGTTSITLGANKAYLQIPVPTSNSVRGFKFAFAADDSLVSEDGGFVDGINEVKTANDETYYNLNGLRVNTLRKGIYIVNGKKVVVVDNQH